MNSDEKQCPYCSEVIKSSAVKCKHCGSDLVENNQENQGSSNISYNSKLFRYTILIAFGLFILTISNPPKSSFVSHVESKVMTYANQNGGVLGVGLASFLAGPIINKSVTRTNFYIFSIFTVESNIAKMLEDGARPNQSIHFIGLFHLMYYKLPNGVAESLLKLTKNEGNKVSTKRPNNISALIEEESKQNSICRGASGEKSEIACEKRDKLILDLNNLGWCYGKQNEASYQMEWHQCTTNSYKK